MDAWYTSFKAEPQQGAGNGESRSHHTGQQADRDGFEAATYPATT
jgi:hypothetical protein